MSIALIDADIIAYRSSASAEQDPLEVALVRCDVMMRDILSKEANYIAFLSGPKEENFRYLLNSEYKANRTAPKPRWLVACKEFLIREYGALIAHGCEADDLLGVNQTSESTIYSIDKDLLTIPGAHFNFVTQKYLEVSELEGLQRFYKQVLIGDTSDNIFGIRGIGKAKAAKLIDHLVKEQDMIDVVSQLFEAEAEGLGESRFIETANLVWIWRKNEETYSHRMDTITSEELHYKYPQSRVEEMATEV